MILLLRQFDRVLKISELALRTLHQLKRLLQFQVADPGQFAQRCMDCACAGECIVRATIAVLQALQPPLREFFVGSQIETHG